MWLGRSLASALRRENTSGKPLKQLIFGKAEGSIYAYLMPEYSFESGSSQPQQPGFNPGEDQVSFSIKTSDRL